MSLSKTPAGVITKEQTLLSTRRLPVAVATTLTKGQLCEINPTGYIIVSSSSSVNVQRFVALATVNNSAGTGGDLSVPLAVRGHFVTVVADEAINPGDWVKASSGTQGRVKRFVPGTDDNNLKVGIYWGKESGIISKAATTPYLESFADTADFVPVVCAQTDVIEVELV